MNDRPKHDVIPFPLNRSRPPLTEQERLDKFGDPHAGIISEALKTRSQPRKPPLVLYSDEVLFAVFVSFSLGLILGLIF